MSCGDLTKNKFFVYLLRCCDGTLYCGITNDLERRLRTHNAGKGSRYTRARLPVLLAYAERAKSKSAALKREYKIKSYSRARKEKLVNASSAQLPDRDIQAPNIQAPNAGDAA